MNPVAFENSNLRFAIVRHLFGRLVQVIFVFNFALFTLECLSADPLNLTQTIPLTGVKGRFDHFSIDLQGKRVFVAALGNNTVEVIDVAAGKRLQSIAGMSKPQGILFLPTGKLVVANGEDGTVKSFESVTFNPLNNLSGLPDADNVRQDPHSTRVWIGYGDGALVAAVGGLTKEATAIKLPGHPESFQLEKQGSRIFINVPDSKQIAVADAQTLRVQANWPMDKFQANFPMALEESNHRLCVGCRKPPRLVILETETGKHTADLAISGDTDDLFYDAKRKRIYISCGEGFIDVVAQSSPDSYERIAKIPTAAGARTCFFSPDLDRLFLAVPARGHQNAELRVYQPE